MHLPMTGRSGPPEPSRLHQGPRWRCAAAAGPAAATAHLARRLRSDGNLQGDETTHRRIRDAIAAGLDVTREAILEGRVLLHRNDEVIPTLELFQRPVEHNFLAVAGKDRRDGLTRVGVSHLDVCRVL